MRGGRQQQTHWTDVEACDASTCSSMPFPQRSLGEAPYGETVNNLSVILTITTIVQHPGRPEACSIKERAVWSIKHQVKSRRDMCQMKGAYCH